MSEPPDLPPDADPPKGRPPAPPRPTAQAKARPAVAPRPRPEARPKPKPKVTPAATGKPAAEPSAKPAAEPSARPAAQPSAKPAAEPTTDAAGDPASDAFVDRRVAPRFDLMAQIWVKHAKLTFVMDVKNVSESGILLEVAPQDAQPRWIRVGQGVELQLFLLDVGEDLLLNGTIARVERGNEAQATRFAVAFGALDDAATAGVHGMLQRAMEGQPALAPPPLPSDE